MRDALLDFHKLHIDPEDIIDKLRDMIIATRWRIKKF